MTGCQDLLSKLLVAKEGERIDMQTLMRHPWVNDNCPMLEPCKKKIDSFNELDLDSTALEVRLYIPIKFVFKYQLTEVLSCSVQVS